MTRLLRADDVPATSRVDYWRHVVDETLGPLDLQLPSGPDLRDELLIGDAGAVRVAQLSTPPQVEPAVQPSTSANRTWSCARSTCWRAGARWSPRTADRPPWRRATSPSSTCRAQSTGPRRRCK
jgi:hypothetical protein